MKKSSGKRCNCRMVFYELRNINGNLMPHFFGIIFPNIMCFLLSQTVISQVPEAARETANTSLMLSLSLVIPMSIMFLGYGALYAQEVEREIPLRMRLFGYGVGAEVLAKVIAHLIFMTFALTVYGLFQGLVMDMKRPTVQAFLGWILSLYLIGGVCLVLAHGIAGICRKFSLTFGIDMILYFMIMILTGMMGIKTDQLPKGLQKCAALLPMTHISNDYVDFWLGGSYRFMPLLQSFLFLGAAAGIVLLISNHTSRRQNRV
ncbi:MAG: ABC transporter permease [Lachnospiraceae bacterium]|nr:ABC transporter permease [Lachnospiraceae bacterium]